MARLDSYPLVEPADEDRVVGIDVSDLSDDPAGSTRGFLLSKIARRLISVIGGGVPATAPRFEGALHVDLDSASLHYAAGSTAADWTGVAKTQLQPVVVTGADYTLALADIAIQSGILMSSADPNSVIVPADATEPIPVGSIVSVLQAGAGQTTVTAEAGVTINGIVAGSLLVQDRYSGAALWKVGPDEWIASGNVA